MKARRASSVAMLMEEDLDDDATPLAKMVYQVDRTPVKSLYVMEKQHTPHTPKTTVLSTKFDHQPDQSA